MVINVSSRYVHYIIRFKIVQKLFKGVRYFEAIYFKKIKFLYILKELQPNALTKETFSDLPIKCLS